MADVRVFYVEPRFVERFWKLARSLIEPAFAKLGDSTIEVTEAEVLSGQQLLWLAARDGELLAAATTALMDTPRFKMCVVTSCGGPHSSAWNFIGPIERYAEAAGCDLMRVMGRRGWKKVLKGYSEPWIVLDKKLKS